MRVLSLAVLFVVVAAPVVRAEDAAPAAATDNAAKPADAPPADAPAAATGLLSLTSTPSGKVFVDDKDTGLTTPVTDFAVAAGTHTIKIVADDGRSTTSEFTIEAGGSLSLNLNLPEAEAKPADVKPEERPVADKPEVKPDAKPADVATPGPAAAAAEDWTWMTVSGWAGLGLGTIGLLAGAVVLTTPTDPDQGPLGFGLFGGGVGLVLGGAVLLYLDNEIGDAPAIESTKAEPKAALLGPAKNIRKEAGQGNGGKDVPPSKF